jgi:hypothetical protein
MRAAILVSPSRGATNENLWGHARPPHRNIHEINFFRRRNQIANQSVKG